jgi:putative flippase GtrA
MTGVHVKLFRYFLTAGVASIVDVGGFAALCFTPLPVVASAAMSFCVAALVNYLLSSRFAFGQPPTWKGFGMFFLAATGGLTVNVLVTLAGSAYFGLPPVIAKIGGVGTAFLLNFWLNLRVVFRPSSIGHGP